MHVDDLGTGGEKKTHHTPSRDRASDRLRGSYLHYHELKGNTNSVCVCVWVLDLLCLHIYILTHTHTHITSLQTKTEEHLYRIQLCNGKR